MVGFNPFEKYARQFGSVPQVWGEHKKCLKPPPRQGIYVFPSATKNPSSFSRSGRHWKATLQHPKIRRPHASTGFGVCMGLLSKVGGEKRSSTGQLHLVGGWTTHPKNFSQQFSGEKKHIWNHHLFITYFGWNYPRQYPFQILDRLFCWPCIGGFHVTPLKKRIGLGQRPTL